MRLIDATPEVCWLYLYDHLDDDHMMAAQNAIDEMPTVDAVPVVRCDKCENWERDWEPNHSDGNQHFCPMIGLVTDADFFCKDGERKDDE